MCVVLLRVIRQTCASQWFRSHCSPSSAHTTFGSSTPPRSNHARQPLVCGVAAGRHARVLRARVRRPGRRAEAREQRLEHRKERHGYSREGSGTHKAKAVSYPDQRIRPENPPDVLAPALIVRPGRRLLCGTRLPAFRGVEWLGHRPAGRNEAVKAERRRVGRRPAGAGGSGRSANGSEMQ